METREYTATFTATYWHTKCLSTPPLGSVLLQGLQNVAENDQKKGDMLIQI